MRAELQLALDVTDDFAVHLGSGVEAEGGLDLLVLQVAVDRLGAADDLDGGTDSFVVLSQDGCVGIESSPPMMTSTDVELLQDLGALVELFLLLELGTTRADDVETTRIAVLVDDLVSSM